MIANRCVVAVAALVLCVGCQSMKEMTGMAPSVDGHYMLDYRELPDGKRVHPPEVVGMCNLEKGHRNFNVTWKDGGKQYSVSTISKYSFDGKTWTEESMFYLENTPAGMKYGAAGEKSSAAVTHKDGKWEFKFPLHDEPSVVFSGKEFVATRPGVFVDHWSKR
jgi:hypothetical protein